MHPTFLFYYIYIFTLYIFIIYDFSLRNFLFRSLMFSIFYDNLQIYKQWGSSTIAFKINSMCTDTVNIDSLSKEDKEKILQVINGKGTDDLLQ